jgi:hypothetical protein
VQIQDSEEMDGSQPLTPAQRQARYRQHGKNAAAEAAERLADAQEAARLATAALELQTQLVCQITEQLREERDLTRRGLDEITRLRAELQAQQHSYETETAELQRQLERERQAHALTEMERNGWQTRTEEAERALSERGLRAVLRELHQDVERQQAVANDLQVSLDDARATNDQLVEFSSTLQAKSKDSSRMFFIRAMNLLLHKWREARRVPCFGNAREQGLQIRVCVGSP